ncbi:MAG: hypothetical protein LBN21_10345, partial [Treponema sp.]|nr:hypothetical protein [Treponema sp.]
MKLYSRGQVLFFSILSALIVMLFALGLGLLGFPGNRLSLQKSGNDRDSNAASVSEAADIVINAAINTTAEDTDSLSGITLQQSRHAGLLFNT